MDAIERLKQAVGPRGWTDDLDRIAPHLIDWRGRKRGVSRLMLMPTETEELAAVVRIAAANRIALVPQGGNTSLCGASVPESDGDPVIVSMLHMNRIRSISTTDDSLVAEAGVILQTVQEAAAAAGRMFPLSLGAKGSATVGGLVSTNAGGVQVLRYGTMRALVLGLEAVLPSGEILDQLSALRKDNSGYDIKQLLIGAEGTLGFVTAVALRLVPAPAVTATALVGLRSPEAALGLLSRLRTASGDRLDSFELMPRVGIDLVLSHIPGARDPLAQPHPWYVLAEMTSTMAGEALDEVLTQALSGAVEVSEIEDAVVAASEAQRAAFWAIREGIPEAERLDGASIKHDVSVPVERMPMFMAEATRAVESVWLGARVLAFGHLGDGNVHFNVRPPVGADYEEFSRNGPAITARVNDLTVDHEGSISAEHGIGTLKKSELQRLGNPAKLSAMRAVKQALDPLGIMNPGKIL